jgi:tetratricopeptide (TPR) repeat protein
MRWIAAASVALVVCVLAAVQLVSSVALRASAQAGSWVRLVPQPLAAQIERVDPAAPLPPALRLVLARNALSENDPARAQAYIARLPASADRMVLEGNLAEARGDVPGAVRAYLAAGDLNDLEARVEDLRSAGQIGPALTLAREIVARLRNDPTQADALAQAYWNLGHVEESKAYQSWVGSPERNQHERLAAAAYARAVALAPLQERYLIAYANQQLNLEQLGAAATAFSRAQNVDPASADPLAGLGEVAHRRGDAAAARAYLARARALDAHSEAVIRLARELGA